MASLHEKLLGTFKAAAEIHRTFFNEGADQARLSVEGFRDHIAKTFGLDIQIKFVDVETKHFFGYIERFGERGEIVRIYIVKNIAPRWQILVAVKELCHPVVDSPEDWQADGEDTLARLTSFIIDIDAEENRAIRSEDLAEVLAWELLYPHENRYKDNADLAGGVTNISRLASRYRLPEEIISEILQPPYLAMCDKYWALVHAGS